VSIEFADLVYLLLLLVILLLELRPTLLLLLHSPSTTSVRALRLDILLFKSLPSSAGSYLIIRLVLILPLPRPLLLTVSLVLGSIAVLLVSIVLVGTTLSATI
jgi:hypothetical protein